MIYILYDCPIEGCDKIWLYKYLNQFSKGKVIAMGVPETLASIGIKGGVFSKLRIVIYVLVQVIKCLLRSNKDDIIICWSERTGLYFNLCSRYLYINRRKIVAMNWLTPPNTCSQIGYYLYKLLASNKMATIIVNSPKSASQWMSFLHIEHINSLFVPDTINETIGFEQSNNFKSQLIFTGGMNNRDWNMVIEIAKILGDFTFICIALKEDWDSYNFKEVPNNVTVLFNTSVEEYYRLLRKSKLVLLPLKEDKVSGLINITISAQFGIPCVVSKTTTSALYYNEDSPNVLDNNIETWVSRIERIMEMPDDHYIKMVVNFQDFIQSRFHPSRCAESIYNLIINKKTSNDEG